MGASEDQKGARDDDKVDNRSSAVVNWGWNKKETKLNELRLPAILPWRRSCRQSTAYC